MMRFRRECGSTRDPGWVYWGSLLRRVMLIAALSSVIPALAAGEEINLDQALSLFYVNNYDLLISRYEIDKAYADYRTAKLRPNPVVSANAIGVNYYSGYPKRDDTTQITVRIDQIIGWGASENCGLNRLSPATNWRP